MHYGPADYIRTRVRDGKTVLELISRGITLMLGQSGLNRGYGLR